MRPLLEGTIIVFSAAVNHIRKLLLPIGVSSKYTASCPCARGLQLPEAGPQGSGPAQAQVCTLARECAFVQLELPCQQQDHPSSALTGYFSLVSWIRSPVCADWTL